MEPLISIIIIAALFIATITDLKTREVPNWLSYSLIFIGLGVRGIYSLVYSDMTFFVYGAAGFIVFLLLAYALFYTGQWGGGDSKLLMGMGALIGLEFSKDAFLISFLINILLVGAVYAIIFSVILALLNPKKIINSFKKISSQRNVFIARRGVLLLVLFLVIVSWFFELSMRIMLLSLAGLTFVMFFIWLFVKSVEMSCMIKMAPVSKLTEGDWVVKDVMHKGKRVAGPKDLGISLKQIQKLKRLKIKKVLIKQGIPFVPSFLIGFILTLIYGNLFLLLI